MKRFYTELNKSMNRFPFFKSCVFFLSRFCPWIVGVFYFLFLLKLYLENGSQLLFKLIIVPIIVIIMCAILRVVFNRQRPWEKYHFSPIDDKLRRGHSFPSVHVGLAVSIALCIIPLGPNMGRLMITMALCIIVSRLLTGLHYLSDIAFSIAISIIVYLIL